MRGCDPKLLLKPFCYPIWGGVNNGHFWHFGSCPKSLCEQFLCLHISFREGIADDNNMLRASQCFLGSVPK